MAGSGGKGCLISSHEWRQSLSIIVETILERGIVSKSPPVNSYNIELEVSNNELLTEPVLSNTQSLGGAT